MPGRLDAVVLRARVLGEPVQGAENAYQQRTKEDDMPDADGMSSPGIRVEEMASSARAIVPGPTSTTVFIGRALRGPVNEPTLIGSFRDFGWGFGGLWQESHLGYAVADFFLNGGEEAIILRLFNPGAADPAQPLNKAGITLLDAQGGEAVTLEALHPGAWGGALRARVTYPEDGDAGVEDLFDLALHDPATGVTEEYLNLSVAENSTRRIDRVLARGSGLARLKGAWSGNLKRPAEHGGILAGTDLWDDGNAGQAFIQASGGSDGEPLTEEQFLPTGAGAGKEGIGALDGTEPFALMVIPPYKTRGGVPNVDVDAGVRASALQACVEQRAMLLVDPPPGWIDRDQVQLPVPGLQPHENAVSYFPRIRRPDPLDGGKVKEYTPSGAVAGVIARTDRKRGLWKAPAGTEAGLRGVDGLSIDLNDVEAGELNALGINCLRTMPVFGHVVWGARTMAGHEQAASEWKYLSVRRLALYIEGSLYRGTQWAVFEPNDEPLWAMLRDSAEQFMDQLCRRGAFQGQRAEDAYFVRCDRTTTSPGDITRGIVNVLVGFAPLKPAEFVILRIEQRAGQTSP